MNEFGKEKVMPGKLFYSRISYDGSISSACPVESIEEAEALAAEAHIENEYGNRWIVAYALLRYVSVSYAMPGNDLFGNPNTAQMLNEESPDTTQIAPPDVIPWLQKRLRLSPAGKRNETAYRCGISLGKMVGSGFFDGILDEYEAERKLVAAAMGAGLSEGEATAAVRSGMCAGMANVKSQPLPAGNFAPTLNGSGKVQ